jgi:hypothetical protein
LNKCDDGDTPLPERRKTTMKRGDFLKRAGIGSLVLAGPVLATAGPAGAVEITGEFKDEGAGTYSDGSVGNQISNFTINRCLVTCGVGTIAVPPDNSGPFAMLMISTNVKSYHLDRDAQTIRAEGRMRSITQFGGTTAEDEEHDFIAIAVDTGAANMDRFDVHFTTTFWNPANPLCTPSLVRPGWCRFGGVLLRDPSVGFAQLGDVDVHPNP